MYFTDEVPGKLKSIDELHPLLMTVKEVVVLDIETTGFSPEKHSEIIEIGALCLDIERSKVLGKFSTFVRPAEVFSIPKKISELTNISWSDVADAPFIEEVLPNLAKFIGNRPIVAHNAIFDWTRFLVPIFETVGIHMVNDAICSLMLSKNLFPKRGSAGYNLKSLCEMYGVKIEGHHRAYTDCRYTASLFMRLIQEYRYRHENDGQGSMLSKSTTYIWPEGPGMVSFETMKILRISCYEGASKKHGPKIYVTTNMGCISYSPRRRVWTVVRLHTDLDAPAQKWGEWVLYLLGLDTNAFVQRYTSIQESA